MSRIIVVPMLRPPAEAPVGNVLSVVYQTNDAELARLADQCAAMTAADPAGYKEVVRALAVLRTTRTDIERRRVELKADALAYGRIVDGEAKRLTALVVSIEEPLSQKKHDVDYEKNRLRLERERVEREALDAQVREMAEERARVDAEREAAAAAERARVAALAAEAEQTRMADEAARARDERIARAKAIQPDLEKVTDYCAMLRSFFAPVVGDADLAKALCATQRDVCRLADTLEASVRAAVTA